MARLARRGLLVRDAQPVEPVVPHVAEHVAAHVFADVVEGRLAAVKSQAKPLNRLILLLNLLGGIAGLPALPAFDDTATDAETMVDVIDPLIAALTEVRSKIPL